MPELPEVETVCRGLRPSLEGARLISVVQRRPDLRFPLPPDFVARLEGRRVRTVTRRAKYILIELDDETVVMAHLGMSGRMTVFNGDVPPAAAHDHIDLVTDDGATVRFRDPRRFGYIMLTRASEMALHPMLRGLGPEPLGNGFNAEVLGAALAGRRTPIKAALLDQRVVAGLGNIYVCEALHRAAISPRRLAATVPGARAERLVSAIREVLADAIAAGGSSLRDYVQASGDLGYFQHRWRVYGREGERCTEENCAGIVRRIVQAGRSTFYCATHQR